MKNTITLLVFYIILITLTSCTDSDDNIKNELKYSVELEQVCRENGAYFCISKQEYDRINELISIPPNDPCIWITIKDIHNNNHNGYYRSSGVSSSNSSCN